MAEEAASGSESASGSDDGTDKSLKKDSKKQVKNEHILIGVGVAGLLITFIYLRKSSAASQAAASTNANQTAANPYGATAYPNGDPYGYDSSGTSSDSSYNDSVLAGDIQQLQSEITGLTPPAGTTTPVPTTSTGSSAAVPAAPTYTPITSWAGAKELLGTGAAVDYAVPGAAPGTYLPVYDPTPETTAPLAYQGGPALAPGTQLFQPS